MSEQIWWYVARSSGVVAWWLLAFAASWGVLYRSKLIAGRAVPKWLLATHRFSGGLAVTFTGIHIGALVADSYVHFGWADVLVPFASDWKSGAVAWGVVGFWLLIAIELTSLMMKHLPRKLWLGVHLSSYPLLWMATIHGATAGTDARNRLYVAAIALAVVLMMFLVTFRILGSPVRGKKRSAARATTAHEPRAARTRTTSRAQTGEGSGSADAADPAPAEELSRTTEPVG